MLSYPIVNKHLYLCHVLVRSSPMVFEHCASLWAAVQASDVIIVGTP